MKENWLGAMGLTAVFWTIMCLLLEFNVIIAFDSPSPGQVLSAMFVGAVYSCLAFSYYNALTSLTCRKALENIPSARLKDLLANADVIATTNHQRVELERFPLSFFKDHKISSVYIYSGCSWISKTTEVEFKLDHILRPLADSRVVVSSARTPIELAPDWLRVHPSFQEALKREIKDIEKEMGANCKANALAVLQERVK